MSRFKFSTAAFMLGQISCEMIALSSHLNTNGDKKLNGELKEIDDIINRVNKVKKIMLEQDECV